MEALDFTSSFLESLGPNHSTSYRSLDHYQLTLRRTSSTLFAFSPFSFFDCLIISDLFFRGGSTSANLARRRLCLSFHRSFPSSLSHVMTPHMSLCPTIEQTMSHTMPNPMRSGRWTALRTPFSPSLEPSCTLVAFFPRLFYSLTPQIIFHILVYLP